MHRHSDFSRREIPLSQLTHPLSPAAEAGEVGRGLGYLPARQMTPSRESACPGPRSVRYVWPSPSAHHPLPDRPRA